MFKVQFNKNLFKGISVQGNTIEIFEQSEESYFDKYLNEVLYLFENSGKDVIVFEDMDRYNTNQIFQRLREINTLINIRKNDTDKPLRFFYLLRDDIFINKDRTKFFDFIMPVVPILDSSNSFDQFIKHFKQGNIYHLFNEHFLQEISLYIDDMRILKNIYNEFLIYSKCISTTGQDPNKLLAIIIYKNIFPRDFSELQLSSGFVHTLYKKKEDFIKDEISRLENEIKNYNHAIETAENEHLKNIEEVDHLYNPKIQDLERYYGENEKSRVLREESKQRKENLKNKTKESQNHIKELIHTLESSIVELAHKKLHEVINKQNEKEFFKITYVNEIGKVLDFNDIKGSNYFPLIKFLIRNGYIDETYPDYMTYFYAHSLSRIDKIFLRSITDEEAKDYSYQLIDPSMIIARLNTESFNKEEILNFSLISYLLDNQNGTNKDKLLMILQQLKVNKNFKFIDLYFESGKAIAPFIQALNSIWPFAFNSIVSESKFTDERKKQYALESLYYTEDNTLKLVDSEGVLSGFVSTHNDFLNIPEPNIQRLINTFELLNVKFESIDYEISNKELFQAVYQHKFYIINYELVCLMLKKIYGCYEEAELKHKNYTVILGKFDEILVSYVKDNINDYVEVILNNCGEEILDSEEAVKALLNEEHLDITLKETYIDMLKTPIHNLPDIINDTLWSRLLACNLVVYSERNVLEYFFRSNNGLNKLLITFINENGNSYKFDYDAINSEFEKSGGSEFFNSVVISNELNLTPYSGILKSLDRKYKSFNIVGISDTKIEVLIDQDIITMIPEVLIFMRENYPQQIMNYIKHNIQEYIEDVISKENFSFDEMCKILQTDVDDQYKLSLLQYTDEPIPAMVDAYSNTIKKYILENNLDSKDIPELLEKYLILPELHSIIQVIAKENIDEIIENEYSVPVQLCQKLFLLDSLLYESKLKLFSFAINNFNESECKECLVLLERSDVLSVFSGKRPAIPITTTNKKILDSLISKQWIVGYDVDKKDENMYRVSSKRVVKRPLNKGFNN